MEENFRSLLAAEFAPYQVLSEVQLDILESHYALLCKWNKKINLCRIRGVQEAVELHYCESLYLGQFIPAGPLRIADLGSGAGFPGFPIAVLRADCEVDLIESDQRKAAFLREARGNIRNLRVVAGRAEDSKAQYDWVVSRAVGPNVVRALHLAPNYALLSSEAGNAKIPWGDSRFIQVFHVEPAG
jgi:16S rRNA (guanine(527)-N(7))-methyltransferase RsmG